MPSDKQERVRDTPSHVVVRQPKHTHASETLFTSDRKGDTQNLTYGSLDKYKVPRYRAAGYGRLLGLDRRFRVISTSDAKRDIHDDSSDTTRKDRNVTSLTTSNIVDEGADFVGCDPADEEEFEVTEQHGFIRLGATRHHRRRKVSIPEDDRVVQRICSDNDSDSDLSLGSLTDSDDTHPKHAVKQPSEPNAFEQFRNHPDNVKQVELSRQTDQDPLNAENWLALISHQEHFFLLSTPDNRKSLTSSARLTIADIRLSLYERALTKIVDTQAREKLLLGYLGEGTKIWDTKTQLEKWLNILQQNPSFDLWYQFLNFQQSNFIDFSYEQCLATYSRILAILQNLDDDHTSDKQCCYWILRLTTFMDQSGFAEHAVAIWQAMLELNFFTPESVLGSTSETSNSTMLKQSDDEEKTARQKQHQNVLPAFGSFWDEEATRIGEHNAQGWYNNDKEYPHAKSDTELPQIRPRHVFLDWVCEEARRSRNDILPARAPDDTVEDDPYRVIISSDIKDYLMLMRTDTGKQALLHAFLQFCDLPPLDAGADEYRSWWRDPFLCHRDFKPAAKGYSRYSGGSVNIDNELSHFIIDSSSLFPCADWFSAWDLVRSRTGALLDFTSRVLTQLVPAMPDDDNLAVYTIAMRFHHEPPSARKYAKSLLKKRPESLPLYNAYALLEARYNKLEVATKVWSTAISMAPSLDVNTRKHVIFLWHDLVQESLHRREYNQAINALFELVMDDKSDVSVLEYTNTTKVFTPTQHLKAESLYRDHIVNALLSHDHLAINTYTNLFAIFKYLTNNLNLDEALAVYESTCASLNKATSNNTIEHIHQSRARLIHTHARHSPSGYKPSQLLAPLKQSRAMFPNNTIFHHLYEHYSRRAGLVDRLRDLNNTNDIPLSSPAQAASGSEGSTPSPIIPSLLKISQELSRPAYSGSTSHSIRSAFRTATSSLSGPANHNPSTWQSWLNWELSLLPAAAATASSASSSQAPATASLQIPTSTTKRLKEIYLSSLRACPWSKDLYLQGFSSEVMREVMGEKALKEVYGSMRERGIRIRLDISDLLEETKEI